MPPLRLVSERKLFRRPLSERDRRRIDRELRGFDHKGRPLDENLEPLDGSHRPGRRPRIKA